MDKPFFQLVNFLPVAAVPDGANVFGEVLCQGQADIPKPPIQTVLFRIVRDAKKPTPMITGYSILFQ